jgi:glycosyltransferase involved in cell wall biosynthesis
VSTPARATVVRADPGVVSIVIAVGDDLTAAATSVDAVRALRRDDLEIELVLVSTAERFGTLVDLDPTATAVDAGAGASVVACRNAGARSARGEYLAFLTPGFRPEPAWITGAIQALRLDARQAACASWMLRGSTIAFAGSAMAVTGDPISPDTGRSVRELPVNDAETFFPSDDAFVVDARAFAFVDGFDERLGPRTAAADLGWRLRLRGLGVVSSPRSRVQVPETSTEEPVADPETLGMLVKNLGEDSLGLLGVATLLTSRRPGGAEAVAAVNARMDAWLAARAEVQADRLVPESEILPRFRDPEAVPGLTREETRALLDQFGVARIFEARQRIAVVTPDVLRPQMAGPAIRAWRMSIALSRAHEVHLASTVHCELQHDAFAVSHVDDAGLRELEAWCDVLIFQGHVMHDFPFLQDSRKVLIVDVYDPIHLEVLEQSRELSDWDRRNLSRITVEVLNQQLSRGDHFLCASEKQRDFWLGQLAGVGRLNPSTYDDGENLERLISVVPFGLDDDVPARTRPAIRGVVPGIEDDAKIVLWGGGIYNWFDPLTLIRAIDKLRRRLPEVRLYFMGLTHPNPNTPSMRMGYDAQRLSEELGLTDEFVFFNEGWVDYDDRQNYLLDADVGVSTHLDHVETAFSFRTRILDYFWASLPVVATAGDAFAELIEARRLGLIVPPEDVDALEDALFTVLTDDDLAQECRTNVAAVAPEYRWGRVLVPVLDLCTAPRRAPDLVDPRQRVMVGDPIAQAMWGRRGLVYSLRVAARHVRKGEYGELTRKARMRVRAALFPESAGPVARGR